MYDFRYDYVNAKYGEKIRLCYMNTNSLIVFIKTNDIQKDISEDVETRLDTSSYELDKPIPKEKNKKVIALMKDELGGKIIKKFIGIRAKSCSYLIDDGREDKKAKYTEKCFIKRKQI